MADVVLVVRMNEFQPRALEPERAVHPEELAEDAAARASRRAPPQCASMADPPTAAWTLTASMISETVDAIRARCDAVTYCTLGRARISIVIDGWRCCATRPRCQIWPGGPRLVQPRPRTWLRSASSSWRRGLYVNTVGTIRHLLEGMVGLGVVPAGVSWTIGSLRLLGALLDAGSWPSPVFTELVVSERLLVTNPATPLGVDQLMGHLPPVPHVDGS